MKLKEILNKRPKIRCHTEQRKLRSSICGKTDTRGEGLSGHCVQSRNLVNEEALAHWGLLCHKNEEEEEEEEENKKKKLIFGLFINIK